METPKQLAKYQTLASDFLRKCEAPLISLWRKCGSPVVKLLRKCERARAKGDADLIREAQEMSDGQIVRKWMWLTAVVGAPVCFLVVPFVLSLISAFLWQPLAVFLWNIARVAMGLVFINFLLAIYFTKRSSD